MAGSTAGQVAPTRKLLLCDEAARRIGDCGVAKALVQVHQVGHLARVHVVRRSGGLEKGRRGGRRKRVFSDMEPAVEVAPLREVDRHPQLAHGVSRGDVHEAWWRRGPVQSVAERGDQGAVVCEAVSARPHPRGGRVASAGVLDGDALPRQRWGRWRREPTGDVRGRGERGDRLLQSKQVQGGLQQQRRTCGGMGDFSAPLGGL